MQCGKQNLHRERENGATSWEASTVGSLGERGLVRWLLVAFSKYYSNQSSWTLSRNHLIMTCRECSVERRIRTISTKSVGPGARWRSVMMPTPFPQLAGHRRITCPIAIPRGQGCSGTTGILGHIPFPIPCLLLSLPLCACKSEDMVKEIAKSKISRSSLDV